MQRADFIKNFKSRFQDERSLNDFIRMERLITMSDGEAKRAVTSIGKGGVCYASSLKTLKGNLGNPVAVSYMKLKKTLIYHI